MANPYEAAKRAAKTAADSLVKIAQDKAAAAVKTTAQVSADVLAAAAKQKKA